MGVGLGDLGQQISVEWLTASMCVGWQGKDPRVSPFYLIFPVLCNIYPQLIFIVKLCKW